MSNLLVEIGTEELPVAALDVIYSELVEKIRHVFQDNRVESGEIYVEATPRRIAFFVANLPKRQSDHVLEINGPSYEKAFDSGGKPTSAMKGFLKAKDAGEEEIIIKETSKGKFVAVQKKVRGKPVLSLLPSLLGEILNSMPFPKLMRWEATGFRFPRPIRWVMALLDKKVVPFELAQVRASSESFGHRFLAPKPFKIREANWKTYQSLLKRHHVVLSLEKREAIIRDSLRNRFHQKTVDEELVHTTAHLVEEPFLVQGSFSKQYLELPPEVLASCMKKNQRIFACYDTRGLISWRFVGVLNGKRRGLGQIRADYENVLESRLRDARFFYETDIKEPLESRFPLLEQIVYLGKLGNMKQKCERLEKLAERFCILVGKEDFKEDLKRVARLSRADLMTQMVYEFPDLQGIVGREYALESGEKEDIAKAVGSQYLPKNLGEDYRNLPKQMADLGALFGIIDRLDLLVGAFGTGLEPTGSQDPFALRRAGGCIVKLIRAFGFRFSFPKAVEESASLYASVLELDLPELKKRLVHDFLKERTAFELQVSFQDRSAEIFQAVWESSCEDIADVYERYRVLMDLYRREPGTFVKAAKVVERTANILKGFEGELPRDVKPELFQEPLEHDLFNLFKTQSGSIVNLVTAHNYEDATRKYGQVFYTPIHDFFDKVMVNVEDPAIRSNRHALMKMINEIYTSGTADLSLLSKLE